MSSPSAANSTGLTGYDVRLRQLRSLGAQVDPFSAPHRAALFTWLNNWGCRQFAKADHERTAGVSLVEWADKWMARLPDPAAQLVRLSVSELDDAAKAYDALRGQLASRRSLLGGAVSDVTYGSTGAAKTLFAVRPDVFPPWDDPIRKSLGYGTDQASFRRYLSSVSSTLREVGAEAGVQVSELPRLLGRPDSSPPKLIDEYNWVVETKRCRPPSRDEVVRWANWAQKARAGIGT